MLVCYHAYCAYILLADAVCIRHAIWRGRRGGLFWSFMSRQSGNYFQQWITDSFYLRNMFIKVCRNERGSNCGQFVHGFVFYSCHRNTRLFRACYSQ